MGRTHCETVDQMVGHAWRGEDTGLLSKLQVRIQVFCNKAPRWKLDEKMRQTKWRGRDAAGTEMSVRVPASGQEKLYRDD